MNSDKITVNWIRENVIGIDTISKRNGIFTARRGFFYTCGGSSEDLACTIERDIPGAVVIAQGQQWTPFRPGAPLNRSSHWWVKFTVEP